MKHDELVEGRICFGGRIALRPIDARDGPLVAYWRNSEQARASFFCQDVVTPDTHAAWLKSKQALDNVFIIEEARALPHTTAIGMLSLRVEQDRTGEYGRLFVDPAYQRQGYGVEADHVLLATAFEYFELKRVWADLIASNSAIFALHRKTHWQFIEREVMNHDRPDCPVVVMAYDRKMWAQERLLYYLSIDEEPPAWTI